MPSSHRLLPFQLLALAVCALALLLVPRATHAGTNPTVRLWATREGLVGRPTASGHVITPNDHFVALPSKSALGKTVVVSYNGKSLSAPVLDIGPWNQEDPYWLTGAARGRFGDLPQWVPEAWAAWNNNYNGGRDAVGRIVTFPAMIDLGDGLYADLGLPKADWVDVTFTWVDGPSPPPLAPASMVITKKADPGVQHDGRYFSQTGYRIDNDVIWSYFNARGGVGVFGYPVSRPLLLLGCPAQVFQRLVAQACPNQGPSLMNVLDPDIFPYTQVNGSTFPGADDSVKRAAPPVSAPDYGNSILAFIRATAPDSYQSMPVDFATTFFSLVTPQMAGTDNPLVNLEMWGAPISKPEVDPNNHNFVYQRFQRGIMHFDAASNRTQGLLLADYLKAIILDRNVPPDLRQQALGSRFFGQYCPGKADWLCRPAQLPATDLTNAFEPG